MRFHISLFYWNQTSKPFISLIRHIPTFRGAMGAWIKHMEPQSAYRHGFDADYEQGDAPGRTQEN